MVGTQLSSLQKPKQKPDSQFFGGKIQICYLHTRVSSPEPPLLLAPRILRPSYGPVLERNQAQAQLSFPETQLSKSIYYSVLSIKQPGCLTILNILL